LHFGFSNETPKVLKNVITFGFPSKSYEFLLEQVKVVIQEITSSDSESNYFGIIYGIIFPSWLSGKIDIRIKRVHIPKETMFEK
jgi:hypothetical protein